MGGSIAVEPSRQRQTFSFNVVLRRPDRRMMPRALKRSVTGACWWSTTTDCGQLLVATLSGLVAECFAKQV